MVALCQREGIDLVVVGPEAPLVAGLADDLRAAGFAVFGPSKDAARLEGSKSHTKALCDAAGIPTAAYGHYTTAVDARAALSGFSLPVVIKADGLAAGKGVIIAESRADAEAAIDDMFAGAFGGAGTSVVIEAFLAGEEVSFFAISDGSRVVPFGSAQDHKRVGDGDTGLNTGGMGAYSPAGVFSDVLEAQVMSEIIEPTVRALAASGTPYIGVLFAGLMLTDTGPQLIEYNCRFGDPECEVLMMRFQGDLAALLHAAATGSLDGQRPALAPQSALTVVVAAQGYPASPKAGGAIANLDAAEANGAVVFHAGTRRTDDRSLVASGGRVLAVTAMADDLRTARDAAYQAVEALSYGDGFWRKDIGWRALARLDDAAHP